MTKITFISKPKNPILDVIFIHGIGGNSVDSWSSKSGHWPNWVAESNPSIRVSSVDYPYNISWLSKSLSVRELAVILTELVVSNDIGTRPIIFIAHSLGGIVVKEMLRQSKDSLEEYNCIWQNTAAVIFLATPTKLSSIFSGKLLFGLFGRPFGDAPDILLDINDFYRKNAPRKGITTLAYAAAKDVVATNVDPGVSDAVVIPVDSDHSDISKPSSKNSFIVVSVQRLISKIEVLIREEKLIFGANKNG